MIQAIRTPSIPPLELLADCVQALATIPSSCAAYRELIAEALLTEDRQGIREALELVDEQLALASGQSPLESHFSNDELKAFEQQLVTLLGAPLPRYAYHGTVVGRLKSIYDHGLIPGKTPVWKGQGEQDQLIRSISDAAVFFSPTWSSALKTWAFMAHMRSRGPKASVKRAPAVIRLSTASLHLERDPAAVNPSWMVRSIVSIREAEAFIGLDTVCPVWRPLHEVIQELR